MILVAFEVLAILITATLGVLWIVVPNVNWEPWIVLSGVVVACIEFSRRFARRGSSRDAGSVDSPSTAGKDTKLRNGKWVLDNADKLPLSMLLPKALQFAKEIGDGDLERWVRLELYGYNEQGGVRESDTVPEYRGVTGRWMDQFNRMLDLSHYPDLSIVNEYRFRFGVRKLEELADRKEMQNISDGELINLLRKQMEFEAVRFCFSPIEVAGVLDVIRNLLLERVGDRLS